MKRLLGLAVLLGCAAGLAAPAVAGEDRQFEGLIEQDPNTYLGFNVKNKNGKKFLVNGLGFSPFVCPDNAQDYTPFAPSERIKLDEDGRFKSKQPGFVIDPDPTVLRISGRLKGRTIKGSVGWRLEQAPDPDCYTGQLAFKISKDTEIDPPPFRAARFR